jgi:hypothetical protein
MRYRPLVTVAAAAALFAALPAHAGGVKTLDGKKTTSLAFSLASSPQDNDLNTVADVPNQVGVKTPFDRPDIGHCPKTECLSYSFKYKPAKGVKPGPFSVKITWTIPGQDYDLYIVQNGADIGHCGASGGTSEVVVIPTPTKNKVYTVVIHEYRAAPDTVKGTISFPAKDQVANGPAPGAFDSIIPTNCGLS